ncbi:MAG: hypothetical protein J6J38_10395 [Lachnospiraceae bacterium]|nr:hypothetical protein [Lachnospiraceae bacterium]
MKRKRRWVVLGGVAILVLLAIAWYKWPVKLTEVDTSEVGLIVLLDGTTGNRAEISDAETISRLMKEFCSVKMQKDGVSVYSAGYHIWVRVCKPDMEIVSDFCINGERMIRRDPFFYKVVGEDMDVEYLERLIKEAQETEE